MHRPAFESLGDDPHGRRAEILGEESFDCAELALADDVVEGSERLRGGAVNIRGDEVHQPVIRPLPPLYLLSGESSSKYYRETNKISEMKFIFLNNERKVNNKLTF